MNDGYFSSVFAMNIARRSKRMNTSIKNFVLTPFNILYRISPEITLCILFRMKQHYKLSLKNPKTFNEKIQWIKLYDKNPLMPICCDKFAVRSYVTKCGCGEILNKLLWEGFDPSEIPFDKLPDKFVLKVTHGSTFNIIQDGTKILPKEDIIKKCNKWLKEKFLPCYGEWFYGVEKPRIIIERYLENENRGQLIDYKIVCLNGQPEFIRVDTDRFIEHKTDLYTCDWKHLDGICWRHPNSGKIENKPAKLEEMLEYARKLSKDFHLARVDFYEVDSNIIFGEITFTPCAGFDKFNSYEFDKTMGEKLKLPI